MISIHQDLKKAAPDLALGIVHAQVRVEKRNEELWSRLKGCGRKINRQFKLEQLGQESELAALRNAYQTLGKDPARYRGSAEALLRRILQGKGLYQVNTAVDLNNLVSLNTLCSVGVYDLGKLQPPLIFRVGQEGETYKGIGKDLINIAGLPVFADALGPYGSPTSDSERAMITEETVKLLLVIIKFTGRGKLQQYLEETADLLATFAYANKTEMTTIVAE
jgi:DNA/RNA-binding domain of Phe-tRNA-synthetase-like protein